MTTVPGVAVSVAVGVGYTVIILEPTPFELVAVHVIDPDEFPFESVTVTVPFSFVPNGLETLLYTMETL